MTSALSLKEALEEAIAESIVSRQGLTNCERAQAVLATIERLGWRLVPPEEAKDERS